jgi:hypothetical protein
MRLSAPTTARAAALRRNHDGFTPSNSAACSGVYSNISPAIATTSLRRRWPERTPVTRRSTIATGLPLRRHIRVTDPERHACHGVDLAVAGALGGGASIRTPAITRGDGDSHARLAYRPGRNA